MPPLATGLHAPANMETATSKFHVHDRNALPGRRPRTRVKAPSSARRGGLHPHPVGRHASTIPATAHATARTTRKTGYLRQPECLETPVVGATSHARQTKRVVPQARLGTRPTIPSPTRRGRRQHIPCKTGPYHSHRITGRIANIPGGVPIQQERPGKRPGGRMRRDTGGGATSNSKFVRLKPDISNVASRTLRQRINTTCSSRDTRYRL